MKLSDLNENKYFIGIMMIILNLGSKHLIKELSDEQISIFNTAIIRKLLIFTVVFIATKDIYVSFIVTVFFVLFINYAFIINKKRRFISLSNNYSNKISREQYENSKKIVEQYLEENL